MFPFICKYKVSFYSDKNTFYFINIDFGAKISTCLIIGKNTELFYENYKIFNKNNKS